MAPKPIPVTHIAAATDDAHHPVARRPNPDDV
jgi:hypothetical protein